jgi:hypothetical protein
LIFSDSGGRLTNGVTVNGIIDGSQIPGAIAGILGGLTLNGTMYLGNASGTVSTNLYFGNGGSPAGNLMGTGTVTFGGANNFLRNDSGQSGTDGQMIIGPNMIIRGKNGDIHGDTTGTFLNQGKIYSDSGGQIQVTTLNFINQGMMQANNGSFRFQATYSLNGNGTLNTSWNSGIVDVGQTLGDSKAFAISNPTGYIVFSGASNPANPQLLEVIWESLRRHQQCEIGGSIRQCT